MEHKIHSVNWHINSMCNYSCKFCFVQGMKGEFTDLHEAERILKKLKNLEIEKINFVGGEPLMHPNILEFVKISKKWVLR
jgi:radical S-adenosyl methionine domain-containing protein 2